jgi:membrane protein
MLRSTNTTGDVIGTAIWLGVIVWGASGLFAQLQNALNRIWEVQAKPGRSPLIMVKNRFLSFGVVILAALTLLGTMVINTTLNATVEASRRAAAEVSSDVERGSDSRRSLSMLAPEVPLSGTNLLMLRAAQFTLSVIVTTGLIAVVYRVLPDVHIAWRDVLVGSAFTGVLLFAGQFAVGLYLARANIGSVFGAAGSLTVILVWVYYSAQILLFGAEFTEVWARRFGHVIRPDNHAMWINESKARREVHRAGRVWADIDARHREEETETD